MKNENDTPTLLEFGLGITAVLLLGAFVITWETNIGILAAIMTAQYGNQARQNNK